MSLTRLFLIADKLCCYESYDGTHASRHIATATRPQRTRDYLIVAKRQGKRKLLHNTDLIPIIFSIRVVQIQQDCLDNQKEPHGILAALYLLLYF